MCTDQTVTRKGAARPGRIALLALLTACRAPTSLTLVLSSDVTCSDHPTTTVTVSRAFDETLRPALTTTRCQPDGRIGTVVVLPNHDRDEALNVRVVTSVGARTTCEAPGYGPQCIVSRRQLRFIAHEELTLPVAQQVDCAGVSCDATTTCRQGTCIPAPVDEDQCQAHPDQCGIELGPSSGQGGSAGVPEPAWMKGKPLFSWFPIPGTEGSGDASVDEYSGFAVRPARSEVWIGLAADSAEGHDNRVVSLDLTLDQPTWVTRRAPSTQVSDHTAYYPDGTPAGRQTYQSIHWVESVNRLLLVGLRFRHPQGDSFPTVDGFNPDTSAWDPQGTWMDIPPGSGVGAVRDDMDRIWTTALAAFVPTTNAWQPPVGTDAARIRFPVAFDSKRRQIVTLMLGDGQGYDLTPNNDPSLTPEPSASRLRLDAPVQEKITLQPGAALTAFIAQVPTYAAMDYDPINDQLYFYDGHQQPGQIYQLTPVESGPWPFTVLPLAASSETPPATPDSGIQNRFQYVPALRGFVMLPGNSSTLYFLRVG